MKPESATPQKLEEIIKEVFEGSSLKEALKKHGLSRGTFYSHVEKNASLSDSYVRALHARTDAVAEEILEIADNDEDPQRARNRIQARQWYASKLRPEKYGERIDLNVNTTIDIKGALEEARARALPMRDLKQVEDAQIVEMKQLSDLVLTGSKPVDGSTDDIFD